MSVKFVLYFFGTNSIVQRNRTKIKKDTTKLTDMGEISYTLRGVDTKGNIWPHYDMPIK
jgi:hypothetical protein